MVGTARGREKLTSLACVEAGTSPSDQREPASYSQGPERLWFFKLLPSLLCFLFSLLRSLCKESFYRSVWA